jgi:hypothetical protein
MESLPSFRASDSDREQVAERLRHATAEGRLTAPELDERLQTVFAARTYGELDALLSDLPTPSSPGDKRVRVSRWAAVAGALTLMLAALGMFGIVRLHSAAEVAVGHAGSISRLNVSGPPSRQIMAAGGPLLAAPDRALFVAASTVGAFVVLLVCAALVWVLVRSRGSVGRPDGPASRFQ